ncbi:MAG: transposase [Candidatus Cloacimonetes bacterium]|nr:transposase [Candidatus Cloacimonadota bacterium]MBL7148871.1 transposase [Candidatus Cloacimonadota bacterium]
MKTRKNSLRLNNYNYSWAGAYFITICSYKKESLFGKISDHSMQLNNFGNILQGCWNQIPWKYKNIKLGNFVIMPNHIHGIIWIVGAIHESPDIYRTIHESPYKNGVIRELPLRGERRKMLLSKIIGRFKMNSSKLINNIRNSAGSHIWQRGYYDHIIRNDEDLNNIKQYIQNNPQNWDKDKNNLDAEIDAVLFSHILS